VGLEFELRLTLANKVVYHLSHISNPFCSGYFADGVSLSVLLWLAYNCNPLDLNLPSR
jgi:hypothetical protein